MSSWTQDELRKITESDDLHVSPYREDGKTYGTPTWIWSVVVDDGLYVRAYNGLNSRWYKAAIKQKAGRIKAAGMTKEVGFEPIKGPINYGSSPYLSPMIGSHARSATVRIVLR